MSAAPLVGVRPSSAAVCPRMAAYQGLGEPAAPRDPELDGYAMRGQQIEDVVAERLRREGRRFRRQVSVPFPRREPFALGHVDFVLPAERTLLEVHSNRGAELEPHKALQLAIYACSRKGTQAAYVVAVDPSSLREQWWPVDFEAMRPQVDAVGEAIRRALDGQGLPGRTCRHPQDSPGRWCPYRAPCFADWSWPEPVELLLLEDVVAELHAARAERKAAEAREHTAKELLVPFVEPGVEHQVGGFRVKRAARPARDTFSLTDYLAAGHPITDELAPFIHHGSPGEAWYVTQEAPGDGAKGGA